MSGGGFAIPRPVRVPGGIRAQSRTGDFARTWWGRRWLEVLRSLDPGVRLGRGKTYARQGQVVSLEVVPGRIHARVQGTRARPYEVEILLRPFGPEEGDRLGARLGEDPRGAARLLGGEMPPDLEGLCTSLGLSLFPRGPEDLGLSCTCPDPSVPCKHLAAVFLLLGEAFDEDPLLLLRFRGLDLEGRRRFPGIQPERADILVGGGAIVETLLEELDLPALETSDRSLRDGLLADYLARTAPEAWGTGLSARERSVLQLGRTCHFDEPHARHIAERAGELFDTGREARLHDLGPRDRELLVYAALLHDIGMFLSFSNHHAHTHYLIRNAELLGFDQTEIQVMAATAFYHRKKLPRRKHPQFAELDEASRRKVRVLCLLLRLAESLDRSHSGVVRSARFREAGKRRVELELYASGECQLELWGLGGHQEDFREVFRKDLVLRAFPTLRRGISGESSDFRKGPQLG